MCPLQIPSPVIPIQKQVSSDEDDDVTDHTDNDVQDGMDLGYLHPDVRGTTTSVYSCTGKVGEYCHQN